MKPLNISMIITATLVQCYLLVSRIWATSNKFYQSLQSTGNTGKMPNSNPASAGKTALD